MKFSWENPRPNLDMELEEASNDTTEQFDDKNVALKPVEFLADGSVFVKCKNGRESWGLQNLGADKMFKINHLIRKQVNSVCPLWSCQNSNFVQSWGAKIFIFTNFVPPKLSKFWFWSISKSEKVNFDKYDGPKFELWWKLDLQYCQIFVFHFR